MSVIEIVPPYVDTALDAGSRDQVNEAMGDRRMEPMPLDECIDKNMATLQGANVKDLKGVATGFADMGVSTWRGASFGKVLEGMGINA